LRGGKGGTFMVGPGRHLASLRHWLELLNSFQKLILFSKCRPPKGADRGRAPRCYAIDPEWWFWKSTYFWFNFLWWHNVIMRVPWYILNHSLVIWHTTTAYSSTTSENVERK